MQQQDGTAHLSDQPIHRMRWWRRISTQGIVSEHDDQISPPLLRCDHDLLGGFAALHEHRFGHFLWHDSVNEPLESRSRPSQRVFIRLLAAHGAVAAVHREADRRCHMERQDMRLMDARQRSSVPQGPV